MRSLFISGMVLWFMQLAGSASAGTITLDLGGSGSTSVPGTAPFQRTGDFSEVFQNTSGKIFTDFHFVFDIIHTDPDPTGSSNIYNNIDTHRTTDTVMDHIEMDFYTGGILLGEHFTITTYGFTSDTLFTLNATIPEPSTVVMACIGVCVFAVGRMLRLRHSRIISQ